MAGKIMQITTADNQTYNGYLATPPAGKGPGLLLIQEVFGVNSHIRDVADLYAMEGFVVLAPDVFFRIKPGIELSYSPEDLSEGISYAQKLDFDQTVSDLTDAAKALRSLPNVTGKVGAVGFCMGGFLTYLLAANKAIDAGVAYYGGGIDRNIDKASNIDCPLLMHFAEKDKFIPMTAVEMIKQTLKAKTDIKVYTYPGVDHGFNCDQRSAYDRKAAMLAYGRSVAFLHRNLE
jgi:carboxymethylenebutenolidase